MVSIPEASQQSPGLGGITGDRSAEEQQMRVRSPPVLIASGFGCWNTMEREVRF